MTDERMTPEQYKEGCRNLDTPLSVFGEAMDNLGKEHEALEADRKLYANALIDLLTVVSIASDDGYDFPPTSKMLIAKADKIAVEFCMKESDGENLQEAKYYGIPIGLELTKEIEDCTDCVEPDKKEDVEFLKLPQILFEPCEKHQKLLDEIREEEQQRYHRTERREKGL